MLTRITFVTGAVVDVTESLAEVAVGLQLTDTPFVKFTRLGEPLYMNKAHILHVAEYDPDEGAPDL